jgi:hypothetical protein
MTRALAALLLAGCAAGVPVERQVVVSGARFQDIQGEAAFFVRTFLPDEGSERREVVGATCTVTSSIYSTEIVTPVRLVVPNFGPQSPELSFACRAGALRGAGRARIVTRWSGPPPYWGPPGPWGYPGWGGWGGWGWYGPGWPISDYPDVRVIMR